MYLSKSYKNRIKILSGIVSESMSNIQELDTEDVSIPSSYIKDSLNPKIWNGDKLNPEIREHLLKIANEYVKYLDIDIQPEKIMFLGSMANYNWNESSDLDLHIVYDFNKISDDVNFVKDFFDTKGSNWNNKHKITLKSYDVEVYVQEKEEKNKSIGVYDLKNDIWISQPKRENITIDKELIKKKASSIATKIEEIEKLSNKNLDWNNIYKEAKKLKNKIKKMRQAGLDKSGEFSAENLAFKFLRNNGYLEKLGSITFKAFDKNLSMDENIMNEDEQDIDKKYLNKVIFKSKRRPNMVIVVLKTPDGRIVEIENEFNINFPFKVGQILNRNHEVWACNNNYFVNDKDTCPEEKVFGIRKKDIPQGHELRMLFPGKFKNESKMSKNIIKETLSQNDTMSPIQKPEINKIPSNEELEIRRIAKNGNLNIGRYNMNELIHGYQIEKEHGTVNPITNVTNDDEVKTLKIALAHLNEVPDYYTKLNKYVEVGVSESLKKKINESTENKTKPKHKLIIKKSVDNIDGNKIKLIQKFIIDCCEELKIDSPCTVFLTGERGGPITTTASYNPGNDCIWIYTKNRNMLADPLRSLAHEIRHFRQKLDGVLTETSGEDGSPHENEAHSFSGYMIRKFGKKNREIFQ